MISANEGHPRANPVPHWPVAVAALSTSLLVMVQSLQLVLVV